MNLYLKTAKSTIIICCLFILQTTAFAQSNIRITIKKQKSLYKMHWLKLKDNPNYLSLIINHNFRVKDNYL